MPCRCVPSKETGGDTLHTSHTGTQKSLNDKNPPKRTRFKCLQLKCERKEPRTAERRPPSESEDWSPSPLGSFSWPFQCPPGGSVRSLRWWSTDAPRRSSGRDRARRRTPWCERSRQRLEEPEEKAAGWRQNTALRLHHAAGLPPLLREPGCPLFTIKALSCSCVTDEPGDRDTGVRVRVGGINWFIYTCSAKGRNPLTGQFKHTKNTKITEFSDFINQKHKIKQRNSSFEVFTNL